MFSLSTITLSALPKSSTSIESIVLARSSVIRLPPVRIAISSNIAFLLSPKAGAFTAATFRFPFILLMIRFGNASPSTSSAIIKMSLTPVETTFSKAANNSFALEIFLSVIKIAGLFNVTTWSSAFAPK